MKSQAIAVLALLCAMFAASYAQKAEGILKVGDPPPALDFRCYKSQKVIDWASLKGQVVVIEFWATWCPPCIENIPHMNTLVKTFNDEPVTFISVTYENEEMVEEFLKKYSLDATIGLDRDFAMFRSFKAWGIPMAVVVGTNGRIAAVVHPKNLSESVLNEVLAGEVPRVDSAKPWPDPEGAEQYFRSLLKRSHPNQ
jgi:thiol-disulfide isomerase/thioredoxin